ncbi:MAG TPA: class I SAM-dependent methyltransferase [Candidatus Acidoferrales bacterium]|nr:class I SAM-dependent methyltransferase [Candidatus Acidoferrales bacterium]
MDESAGGIFTGERLVAHDPLFAADFARHLVAYRYAQDWVRGKVVLDAGCGDGYGTELLSQEAARALGVDRSAETIAVAKQRYHRSNLEYRVCALERLNELKQSFDVVSHFQVIEHLHDPRPFLRQAREVLNPGGALIITTPNRLNSFVENPYHVHEYIAAELRQLLNEVFEQCEILGVCGNDKVMAFERQRGVQAKRILRLDPLGIRHLLPRGVIEWAYARLARVVRRRIKSAEPSVTGIGVADFSIANDAERSLDLLAICRI